MDLKSIVEITAIIKADVDQNKAIDVYDLADELKSKFTHLRSDEIVTLIELTVITIGGAAVWIRPDAMARA